MTSRHPESDGSSEEPAVGGFPRLAVRQALAHLNRCHRRDNLLLARVAYSAQSAPGAASDVTAAWLAGLDEYGVDFVAETARGPVVLRRSFEWPASTLSAAGEQLLRLYRAGCRASR